MKELKGSFVATDEDGQEYIINIYVDMIDASSHDNPNAKISGIKNLLTEDGEDVNYLGKGKYEIVSNSIRIFSDDPNAP